MSVSRAFPDSASQILAPVTWYIPQRDSIRQVEVIDQPRPLALYEMIYPPGTDRAGNLYRIVVYEARLLQVPKNVLADELQGVIALTTDQVMRSLERKPTLAQLIEEGALLIAGGEMVDRQTRLYPIGTALALARLPSQSAKSHATPVACIRG